MHKGIAYKRTVKNGQKRNIEWHTALVESERRGEIDQYAFGARGAFWKSASYERSWRQELPSLTSRAWVFINTDRADRGVNKTDEQRLWLLFNNKCPVLYSIET